MRTLARVNRSTARTLLLLAGLAVAHVAIADMPKVLDRIATDTPMVAVVDSLDNLEAKMKLLSGDQSPSGSVIPEQARQFLEIKGLNKAGSIGLLVWPKQGAAKDAADEDAMPGMGGAPNMDDMMERADVVALLPVSDYKAFVEGLKGEALEGGISKFVFSASNTEPDEDGEAKQIVTSTDMFVKDAGGGFAAVSPGKDFLTSYKVAEGQMAAQTKFLGKVGATIEAGSDVMLITNVSKIKDGIEKGVAQMKSGASEQMMMMGDAAKNAEKGLDMVAMVVNNWARDGRVAILGQRMDEKGLRIDIGTEFSEGTELGGTFAGEAKGVTALANVPDVPFMFAMAYDTASPAAKRLYDGLLSMAGDANEPGLAAGFRMAKDAEAVAMVMGAPPAGAMGGLFTQTVYYTQTKDAPAMLQAAETTIKEMNGKVVEGTTFKTKYKKAVKELGGVKVDAWEMAMEMDPNNEGAQMAQMMQGMIMGAGPMKGFYAAAGDGLVYTMAANEPLMAMALGTAKTGDGLGKNAQLKQVRAELPANSSFEMYLGVKSLGDMALGFASMFAGPVELEIPENLPPIGMGAAIGNSGVHARIFVPTEVMKFAGEAAKQMEEMQGDMMNDMGEEPMADDEEGAPPKF
jgi:hypothetical protein